MNDLKICFKTSLINIYNISRNSVVAIKQRYIVLVMLVPWLFCWIQITEYYKYNFVITWCLITGDVM